jgi:hypothetical protein
MESILITFLTAYGGTILLILILDWLGLIDIEQDD